MSKAGAKSSGTTRPKTSDGETDFAFVQGQTAPAPESMSKLLNKYVPHDEEAFKRLIKPSLKQQAQALDVAKVAMSGLDSVMAFLVQRRKTCGDQIVADEQETAFLDKEIAKKEAATAKIRAHQEECKMERDTMQKALKESIETMQETVRTCHKMTQKTNSNISRLTRTMVPQGPPNYLKSGTGAHSMAASSEKAASAKPGSGAGKPGTGASRGSLSKAK